VYDRGRYILLGVQGVWTDTPLSLLSPWAETIAWSGDRNALVARRPTYYSDVFTYSDLLSL
jgi:hypothetical protein